MDKARQSRSRVAISSKRFQLGIYDSSKESIETLVTYTRAGSTVILPVLLQKCKFAKDYKKYKGKISTLNISQVVDTKTIDGFELTGKDMSDYTIGLIESTGEFGFVDEFLFKQYYLKEVKNDLTSSIVTKVYDKDHKLITSVPARRCAVTLCNDYCSYYIRDTDDAKIIPEDIAKALPRGVFIKAVTIDLNNMRDRKEFNTVLTDVHPDCDCCIDTLNNLSAIFDPRSKKQFIVLCKNGMLTLLAGNSTSAEYILCEDPRIRWCKSRFYFPVIDKNGCGVISLGHLAEAATMETLS